VRTCDGKDGVVPIMCLFRVIIVVAIAAIPSTTSAQIQLSPVATGLTSPVFVGDAYDGSGRLFIVEQGGIIKVLLPGGAPAVFLNIQSRVLSGGERGLLGLAFHPLYSTNGRFFVFYTQNPDGALVVAEYLASPPRSNVAGTTERRILVIPHPGASNHNGGMLAFGGDGYLYIGVGDGGSADDPPNNAQNINTRLGKILRIDVNALGVPYASPSTNPFAGPAAGLDEIYAFGLRNPWRFSFDRQTDQMWVGDVGQGAREEVDTPITSGGNYGWRVWEGTLCREAALCGSADYIAPAFDYAHSGGRCSLTGGYVYRGGQGVVQPGTYLYGDYCSGEIFAWNGSSQSVLLASGLRISSFGEDQLGELYVVDLGGTVSRIVSSATCQFSISPARLTFARDGGTGMVAVTASAGCAWTAESNASWITVTAGTPGTGDGTVTFSVAPYTGKPKNRNGTITIAGQTFSVRQSK
jgi:Glucose / Sorbosone dehydrogenase/Putative binding domain, N-terminal